MPLGIETQRRSLEIGRIRAGISEDTGRLDRFDRPIRKPVRLGTFVFSSGNQYAVRQAGERFGGAVEPWEGQWRVISEASEIPVSIPGGPAALSQFWEMWSGGLCQRRCDNTTELLTQRPCLCPEDLLVRGEAAKIGRACKPKSRINVIVPDLPGLGVWRLETSSWYAAVEVSGTIEMLAKAREVGVLVPAMLRLDHRTPRRLEGRGTPNEKAVTRDFYVPVIDVLPSMRDMAMLAQQPLAAQLPPAPEQMRAIAAGTAPTPAYGIVKPPAAWVAETQERELTAGPRSAQVLAVAARTATTAEALRALWSEADAGGHLGEMVFIDEGEEVQDTLRNVINELASVLPKPAK